jgi:hypothetical protein
MDWIGVDHDIGPAVLLGGKDRLQGPKEVAKQAMGCARPQAVMQRPSGQFEGPVQVVLLILARGHDRHPGPFGHPTTGNFREQMDIQCVCKPYDRARLELLEHPANARQTAHPLRVVVSRHPLGAFPHPADLVRPAAHGLSGDRHPLLALQRQGQRGTALPRARYQPYACGAA